MDIWDYEEGSFAAARDQVTPYIQLLEKCCYGYSHSVYIDSCEGSEECATDKSRGYWTKNLNQTLSDDEHAVKRRQITIIVVCSVLQWTIGWVSDCPVIEESTTILVLWWWNSRLTDCRLAGVHHQTQIYLDFHSEHYCNFHFLGQNRHLRKCYN